MKKLFLALMLLLGAAGAHAELKTEVVEYKQGSTPLEGYLAYDTALKGKRPVILIVHEWTGLGEYVRNRAKELAGKGYVAFALDIYGKGVRPSNPTDAGKEAGKYKDNRKLMRERAKAGLDYIKTRSFVDPTKVIAMGYCFGGTVALEMGRAGLPLAGITSFHGGLNTPTPQDAKNIKGKVLVLHGAIDPFTKDQVPAFQKEMNDAGVDYQFISYSGTVHAFTNPEAGSDLKKGTAYNASSDRRSMQAFMDFLQEVAPLPQ
jgi:dienelactone hydrolase